MNDNTKPIKENVEIANYLLKTKKSGLRARHGKLQGQRVLFFKGKSGINSLLRPQYSQYSNSFPSVGNRKEAQKVMQKLVDNKLILKCTKDSKDNNVKLFVCQDTFYDEENYYVWLYQGSQLLTYLAGIGVIICILAGVMFPLWPSFMREGMWYVSMSGMGFLGFLLVLGVIRFVFWIMTKVFVKPGIWIFPNLFEDCGFFESFWPLWAWDIPPPPRPSKKVKGKAAGNDGDPLLQEGGEKKRFIQNENEEELIAD